MGNNPVVGVDPDGELFFVPILIGALIGGAINVGIGIATGSIDFNKAGWGWNLAASFGIGAAAGAAAVIAPQLIGTVGGFGLTTSTGAVAGGFIPGAVSGAAGGFVGGFGNSMYFGYDKNKTIFSNLIGSIGQGLVGSFTGGVTGGLIGGGLNALKGQSFWGEPVENLKYYQQVRTTGKDGSYRYRYRNINDPGIKTKTISITRGTSNGLFDQLDFEAIDITEPHSKSTNYLIRDKTSTDVWDWLTQGTGGSPNKSGSGFEYFVNGGTRQQGYVWSYYQQARSTGDPTISFGFNGLMTYTGRKYTAWYYKFRFN
jgi:hypothetical protein